MSLSKTIDQIVARRNEVAGSFTEMLKEVEGWERYTSKLLSFFEDNKKQEIWREVLSDSKVEEKGLALHNELKDFYRMVKILLGEEKGGASLKAAEARANRGYVNLGIVGPWRIGKSQIIQQLTHLDTWYIPTESGSNCTACPINVINDTFDGETDVAVIETFTVEEMCSIINEYIRYCKLTDHVSQLTSSTNESFLKDCKGRKDIISHFPCPEGVDKGFYDKMNEYINNAEDYYRELGKGKIVLKNIKSEENKAKYRPYVSYYAKPGDGVQTFKCLAAKEATLYVSFRFLDEEIGKLRLMDTPGIGECKLKVSEGLSKALRFDLDIAVATASAKPNFDDLQQIHSFHEILKKETQGRHPENWLYYMFNCYSTLSNMTVSLLGQRHNQIIKDLAEDLQNGEGIELPESHFADIDALINKGICFPNAEEKQALSLSDCREEGASLSSFYGRILSEMVESIEQVDSVFYDSARTKYYEAKTRFEELLSNVQRLAVFDYNNLVEKLILEQMSSLVKSLGKISPALNLYYRNGNQDSQSKLTLSNKISQYCDENNFGRVIQSVLNCDTNANISEFNVLYNRVEQAIKQRITDSNWRSNQDFESYVRLKNELLNQVKKDVLSLYDRASAEQSLITEKKRIWDVYKNEGKFAEICGSNSEKWYLDFIRVLDENGQYPTLLKIFQDFINYSLFIEDRLESYVTKLSLKIQHMDLFIYDEDDLMPFTEWGKALKAYCYSLYNIESSIKSALNNGDNSYESIINEQEDHFKEAIASIMNIPYPMGDGYSEAGKELVMLYKEYSNIFKNAKDADKNALAIDWNKSKIFKAS